jgi:inward rectifier potassium channel
MWARLKTWAGLGSTVPDDVVIVGGGFDLGRDLYHVFLRAHWWAALGALVAVFLLVNLAFGAVYAAVGGVANARPGSLADGFFFSVQTMATIGYGGMTPATPLTNALVVVEAVVGLLVTALSTGLVFAKFTVPDGRIRFARHALLAPVDGVPTLQLRVGNERGNAVVEAVFHVTLVRTERTAEGHVFYRNLDLRLARHRATSLYRSFQLLHPLGPDSPLAGLTPELAEAQELELHVAVTGTDETTVQPVFGRHRYLASDLRFGHRPADLLRTLPDGRLELDVRRFDDVEPTAPVPGFPYPRRPDGPPPG